MTNANYAKPVVGDQYNTWDLQLLANYKALLQALDPATIDGGGTPTSTPTNALRWNSANGYWEKYNGTTWAALASTYNIAVLNGVVTSGSYANPAWITSLAWSKLTGTPTTIGGYGITDGVVKTTLTTKGDTYIATGSAAVVRQPAPPDGGLLVGDSSATNGQTATSVFNFVSSQSGWSVSVLYINNHSVQISGACLVKNVVGVPFLWGTAVTVDINNAGAAGLDTGSVAPNTWYYGWCIAKPDGTMSAIWSASNSSPTMPSGYTFKALVTCARTDGSNHLLQYSQVGDKIFTTLYFIATISTSGSEQSFSIAGFVPPIAREVEYQLRAGVTTDGSGNAAMAVNFYHFTGIANYIGAFAASPGLTGLGAGVANTLLIESSFQNMPYVGSTMYVLLSGITGTAPFLNVYVRGFRLNILVG